MSNRHPHRPPQHTPFPYTTLFRSATATVEAPSAAKEKAPAFSQYCRAVPVGNLVPSKSKLQEQRRQHFDPAALKELAATIKMHGVKEPILARPLDLREW